MRISDTERREIARKLREIEWRTMPELTDGEILDLLAASVGFVQYRNEDFDEGLLGRIADLIDRPTCRNEEDGYDRSFLCSACGYEAWTYDDSGCDPKDFSFCPNCGKEVDDAERRD